MTDIEQHKDRGSILFVIGVCIVASLGGLLFGYDTGVINGSLKFVQLKFELSAAMKGFAASSALLACIFGAALAGTLSDRLGRKKVLFISHLRPGDRLSPDFTGIYNFPLHWRPRCRRRLDDLADVHCRNFPIPDSRPNGFCQPVCNHIRYAGCVFCQLLHCRFWG